MTPQFLALVTSFFYAGCFLTTRRGLMYATPVTAAYVALSVNTAILWVVAFMTGGVRGIPWIAIACFAAGGWLQLVTRLCAYTGVARMGASVTSTVQATNPLFSTTLAVLILHETVTPFLLSGTGLVVAGISLISWRPQQQKQTYRTWELVFPLTASLSAGLNHPLRRYGLTVANEPLLLSAVMGTAALVPMLLNLLNPKARARLVPDRRAMPWFLITGVFEAIGIWSLVAALGSGNVVVVGPIVCIAPLWVLVGTMLFARDIEQVNLRTAIATLFVITGVVAIYLA